jgi:hypothetical protein
VVGSPAARALVRVAALAGLLHAASSLYWALGGTWLLPTVGRWAVRLSEQHPVRAGLALGVIALGKLVAAVVPVAVDAGRTTRPALWRGISWAGGSLLVVYGGVNTAVALAVVSGALSPAGGYDADAMRGHAYLWDPLFLLWGAALVLSLALSRGRVPAHGRR